MAKKTSLRILTNKTWIAEYPISGGEVIAEPLRPERSTLAERLKVLRLWRYDGVFLDGEHRWLLGLSAVKKLLPWVHCPILSIDIILSPSNGTRGRIKVLLWRWILKEVDRFVLYFRDTEALQRMFAIPPDKIHYVPFKPNTLEDLHRTRVSDGEFFLSAGRSNRDIQTLFEAFRLLPYPCTVLAPWEDLEEHGTNAKQMEHPPNVSLVSDDGTTASWNDWIARARAVVLPIQPGKLSPSGIGTYLVAMALGKCVIITESAATRRILSDEVAVLVPPSDVGALRAAITRVAEDSPFRTAVAMKGRQYALSLGGEKRLRADLARELSDLLVQS
jgi:glycosyltransferase involved in cell wall biosynthesis